MTCISQPVNLCGESLSGVQHICAFFDSREEQYEILNPYFREGLEQNEEVITIVGSDFQAEHRARMEAGNVPIDSCQAQGQLKMLASDETYTQDGYFAVERMYTLLEDALREAHDGPFQRIRTCGDMEWALQNLPGTDELLTYEARVNLLAPKYDCTLLCVYDVNRFSGRVIADVLATHSHIILNGHIHVNPYFIEPLSYLQKLALRRQSAPLSRGN